MDWATLFKENAQGLFTLGGVFLGSVITFGINWLNNNFQTKEREKDRQEQKREASIQSREKLEERDVLKVMDAGERLVKLLAEWTSVPYQYTFIKRGKDIGFITEEDFKEQVLSLQSKGPSQAIEIKQLQSLIEIIIYSFPGTELFSTCSDFINATNEMVSTNQTMAKELRKEERINKETEIWEKLNNNTGKFQRALREKLISLRDT
jgi:hypothetical protein